MFIQSAERIGGEPIVPSKLLLNGRCLTVLERTLQAVWPEEGCALLVGGPAADGSLRLNQVWPACNRWGMDGIPAPWGDSGSGARNSNFCLDPREQLAAQRWSRQHQQRIIGVAHSHPTGEPVPSSADQRRGAPLQLMLILCAKRQLGAWWLGEDREVRPVPIDVD